MANGRNKVERREDGTWVLISYSTKVAAILPDGTKLRTEVRHSNTTERHLTQFGVTPDNRWQKVSQQRLDEI